MAKGKLRNITNRNQGNMAASEPNSPTTATPRYLNTVEKHDLDLKSLVILEEHKKEINKALKEIQGNMNKLEALTMEIQKSLKEIQENMSQQIEANKEEMQKSLKEMQEKLSQQVEVMKGKTQKYIKEIQENTNKQVKELSKTIQDRKTEVEATKKSKRETAWR